MLVTGGKIWRGKKNLDCHIQQERGNASHLFPLVVVRKTFVSFGHLLKLFLRLLVALVRVRVELLGLLVVGLLDIFPRRILVNSCSKKNSLKN